MKEAMSPWDPGQHVAAGECWACRKPFDTKDTVKAVDSIRPKLVHDSEPCAGALTPIPQAAT